jgi:hypothetical protein
VVGLTTYAAEVLKVDLCPIRSTIGAYCRLMAQTSTFAGPGEWDQPVGGELLAGFDWMAMERIVLQCATNRPVPATDLQKDCDVLIVTDASLWGWASLAFFRSGAVERHCAPWSVDDHALKPTSSVCAEPMAIVRAAVMHLKGDVKGRTVQMATDHAGMVFAGQRARNRLYAVRGDAYYNALLRLRELFPGTTFEFLFVAGAENPVDMASRGVAAGGTVPSEVEIRNRTKTAAQLASGADAEDAEPVHQRRNIRKPWMI